MAQIDKLNYLPLLVWFLVFFIFFYFYLVIYVLPVIFGALKVRRLFFNSLINELLDWFFFQGSFAFIYLNKSSFTLVSFFFNFLISLFYLDYCFLSLMGYFRFFSLKRGPACRRKL